MVAGCARYRDAQLPAVLREGGGGVRTVHGAERAAKDARHDLPKMLEVGETVMDAKKPFGGGVIMPHVVSPEMTGGEVTTPKIVQEVVDLERGRVGEERDAVRERRFQEPTLHE